MNEAARGHTAVLLPQVLTALNIRASGRYLDATFGRGGHAEAILEKLTLDGRLLCLDRDPVAIAEAKARFGSDPRVMIFLAPFSELAHCADALEPGLKLDGILLDLGVSSPQLDDPERGFSFMQDGPLDMRMSKGEGASAADVVNGAPEAELVADFPRIRRRAIRRTHRARHRHRPAEAPFTRTRELASLIERVSRTRERHKHPATRVFQALRIHVNGELVAARDSAAGRARASRTGRTSRRDQLPFARGPHGQALHAPITRSPIRCTQGLPDIPAHARPTLQARG